MNMSTSECSSGCESGWTTYLDQSSNSADQYPGAASDKNHWSGGVNVNEEGEEEEEEDEDEDLSMVSDASSGPRHFHEEKNCLVDRGYFSYGAASVSEQVEMSKLKKRTKENRAYLDDTASSPVLSFSKNVSNSQASMEKETKGLTESHSKGKSALTKKFGFLKSSVSGKSTSEKSGALRGRKQ